ncbi:MAG: phosphatase PAP2 family protein [Candidatus Zixiibacteriota bacterium]
MNRHGDKSDSQHPVTYHLMQNIVLIRRALLTIIAGVAIQACSSSVAAADRDYMSAGEVALTSGGTVALGLFGTYVKKVDSTDSKLIRGPLPLERRLQETLGGRYEPGKSYFLDNTRGSIITPAMSALVLGGANLTWPQEKAGKDVTQDMFLFVTGLAATKGLTDLVKGTVGRPRPLVSLQPDLAALRKETDYSYDHQSFFSGHTSGAFFAVTFLNKRLRTILRQRSSIQTYRNWRWAPPTLLFGWGAVVAWSRVHAYKHFPSDVLAGAIAGALMAELFYSFGNDIVRDGSKAGSAQAASSYLLRVNIKF